MCEAQHGKLCAVDAGPRGGIREYAEVFLKRTENNQKKKNLRSKRVGGVGRGHRGDREKNGVVGGAGQQSNFPPPM